VLVIGNDPSKQNPLVAWQIRAGIRHFDSKLFLINSKDIKLKRKAAQFVNVGNGQESAAVHWLATGEGQLAGDVTGQLAALKASLEAQPEVAVVFGSELTSAAIRHLVSFGSKLQGKVRYMALGDYANSRGANSRIRAAIKHIPLPRPIESNFRRCPGQTNRRLTSGECCGK